MNPGEIYKDAIGEAKPSVQIWLVGRRERGKGQHRSLQEPNLTSGLRTFLTLSSAQSWFPPKHRDAVTREADESLLCACVFPFVNTALATAPERARRLLKMDAVIRVCVCVCQKVWQI